MAPAWHISSLIKAQIWNINAYSNTLALKIGVIIQRSRMILLLLIPWQFLSGKFRQNRVHSPHLWFARWLHSQYDLVTRMAISRQQLIGSSCIAYQTKLPKFPFSTHSIVYLQMRNLIQRNGDMPVSKICEEQHILGYFFGWFCGPL